MTENQETIKRNIAINAQYVKDFSFESPNAPLSLTQKQAPNIDLGVDVQINRLQETAYEVTLVIKAEAKSEDNNVFLVELSYAGVFTLDVPEAERDGVLLVYCPNMLFPYARRIVSDITRDGGFPPLMLDPIDFTRIYEEHVKNSQNKQAAN